MANKPLVVGTNYATQELSSGDLVLPANPLTSLAAATKQYVDTVSQFNVTAPITLTTGSSRTLGITPATITAPGSLAASDQVKLNATTGTNTGDQNLAPYALANSANTFTSGAITSSGNLAVTVGSGYSATFTGGNLGIGTTSPVAPLDVVGPVNVRGTATFISGASNTHTFSTTNSSRTVLVQDTGTNGANLALVGNGTTTPNKTLRAQGGNLEFINSAYGAVIATLSDAGSLNTASYHTASAFGVGNVPSAPLDILTGTSSRLLVRTASSGALSIDSITPTNSAYAPLHFNATSYTFDGGTLSVNGDIYASRSASTGVIYFGTNGGHYLYFDGTSYQMVSGGLVIGGNSTAVDHINTSDRRLKKNIKYVVADAFLADKIQLCTYQWKDTGLSGRSAIAQEVAKIAPDYVQESTPANGEGFSILGIDESSLALEAVIGLAARVRALEAQLYAAQHVRWWQCLFPTRRR